MKALAELRITTELGIWNRYIYAVLMLIFSWLIFVAASANMTNLLFRKQLFGLLFICPLYLLGGCLTTAKAIMDERNMGIKQHMYQHGLSSSAYHWGNFWSYLVPHAIIYLFAYLPLAVFVYPFNECSSGFALFMLYMCTCVSSTFQALAIGLIGGQLFLTFFSIFSVVVPFAWMCLALIIDVAIESKEAWEQVLYFRTDTPTVMQWAMFLLNLGFPSFALQNALVFLFRFHFAFEPDAIFPEIWDAFTSDLSLSGNIPEVNYLSASEMLLEAR